MYLRWLIPSLLPDRGPGPLSGAPASPHPQEFMQIGQMAVLHKATNPKDPQAFGLLLNTLLIPVGTQELSKFGQMAVFGQGD